MDDWPKKLSLKVKIGFYFLRLIHASYFQLILKYALNTLKSFKLTPKIIHKATWNTWKIASFYFFTDPWWLSVVIWTLLMWSASYHIWAATPIFYKVRIPKVAASNCFKILLPLAPHSTFQKSLQQPVGAKLTFVMTSSKEADVKKTMSFAN